MTWESSAQTGQLSVWGARAGLGAGVGRPRAVWGPPVILIAGRPQGGSSVLVLGVVGWSEGAG